MPVPYDYYMQKTFSIISLGCPRNLVDSEHIISEFKQKKGYRFQEDILGSDTVIINTCAFIEEAKKESIDTILKVIDAKKQGSVKRIIAAGCLTERYRDELARELKEIDEFRGVIKFNGQDKSVGEGFKPSPTLTPKHYAYIKISEGCGNICTYCVIPYLKGGYRSRPIESIKKEAISLIKNGAKELILIGQDTSLYGIDLHRAGNAHACSLLAELLKELAKISKGTWIRILYLHPANLDKKVIKVIRDNENICKYIDLPIEHISDKILKRMVRRVKKRDIVSLVEYIRKEIPGASIRTSVIAGFPGETEKEFKELLSFIKDMKFEKLGAFKYSREEGTMAYDYKAQVSEKEKGKRFKEIMSLQQRVSQEANQRFKGKILRVLIEEKEKDAYIGRTEYDAPEIDGIVYVKGRNLKIGNFYDVKITDAYEYDLTGEYESGE